MSSTSFLRRRKFSGIGTSLGLVVAVLAVSTCAQGLTGSGDDGIGGSGADGAGGAGGAGGRSTSSSSSSSASSSSSSGVGGAGGSGTGTGGDHSSCGIAPETCGSAEELTGVDGDQDANVTTETGTSARWVTLYVDEDSTGSNPMSFTATLTTPPGSEWDLYVYVGDADGPDCGASPFKAQGAPKKVSRNWGDTALSEDGRWITLEVRWVSGPCDAPWSLSVAGNVP